MKTRLLILATLLISSFFYGQNSFTEHLINQSLSRPSQVYSLDIDGDGDKDFATVSITGELTWHEQTTNSNWETHYISMEIIGQSLAIADLDNDTDMDIVVTHNDSSNGKISWFENDGNQNFTETTIADPNNIIIHNSSDKTFIIDIDNDNDNDVITSGGGFVKILKNDGNQNFTETTTIIKLSGGGFNTKSHEDDTEILDFDNDGLLDFLVSVKNESIYWYKQNTDNSFTKNELIIGDFSDLNIEDIDNDGDYDIVAIKSQNQIFTYSNNGDNLNFTETIITTDSSVKNHLSLGDLNNDSFTDIMYLNTDTVFDNGLQVYLNNNGNFNGSQIKIYDSELLLGSGFNYYILDDINLDNKIDIVQVSESLGLISLYQNNNINQATNNFTHIEVSNSSGLAEGVSVADFNNDNKLDIVVSAQGEHALEWFNNSGDNLIFSQSKIDSFPRKNYLENEAIDIDGDGFIDILSVNYNSTNGGAFWYKNNGDETFTRNSLQINSKPKDIASADFDNDGDIDILTVSDKDIYIFTNDGNENFTSSLLHSNSSNNMESAKTVDVNNDNLLDIVFLGDNNKLAYLVNNGNNSFSTFTSFQNANGTDYQFNLGNIYDFEFADIDNDNDLDFIGIGTYLFYLKNNGSYQIEEEVVLLPSQIRDGRDLQITDIDNDNDLDIIISGSGVYWVKNENLSFSHELITADNTTNANSYGVEIADMDNDGDIDIIYTSSVGNKVAWLENKIDETLSNNSFTFSESTTLVYPNPTEGVLEITSTEKINHILIYDILGKVVYQKKSNKLDLSHLPKGLYFVQINTENNNILIRKILKK